MRGPVRSVQGSVGNEGEHVEQRPTGMWKGSSGRHLEEGVQAKVHKVPYRDRKGTDCQCGGNRESRRRSFFRDRPSGAVVSSEDLGLFRMS